MTVAGPIHDYDTEIYRELSSRGNEMLCRFVNIHVDDVHEPGDFDTEGWRKILAGKFAAETQKWLATYERLSDESVRIDPAIRYLVDNHDVDVDGREPSSIYELALLLHEEGLEKSLNEVIVGARIRESASSRTFVLDQRITLQDLEQRIEDFHETWNKSSDQKKAARVDIETEGEKSICLKITAEEGIKTKRAPVFAFRTEDEEIPAKPEITQLKYRSVKQIRIFAQVDGDQTQFVFTDSRNGWKQIFDGLFSVISGVDKFTEDLQRMELSEATELEDEAGESFEIADDPIEQTEQLINQRRKKAKQRVDKSNLPGGKKSDVKECLDSIKYNGSEVLDDPSVATEEFTLVGRKGLKAIFEKVDIEESFFEFLKTADNENAAIVLSVDERNVAVQGGDYNPTDGAPLSDDAQVSLKYFFNRENIL